MEQTKGQQNFCLCWDLRRQLRLRLSLEVFWLQHQRLVLQGHPTIPPGMFSFHQAEQETKEYR